MLQLYFRVYYSRKSIKLTLATMRWSFTICLAKFYSCLHYEYCTKSIDIKIEESTRDRCVDKLNISYGAQTRLVYPDPADHPVVVHSECMGQ